MYLRKTIWLALLIVIQLSASACTIVAVSGKATVDGRPLLFKNRDSSYGNLNMMFNSEGTYTYLCQYSIYYGYALSGFNETGFSIINAHSYNMPNSDYSWNSYLMHLALKRCSTVDDFQHLLDSLPKPISVCSNYGVMDAQGNVAVFETSAYTYVKYDADSADNGYLVRTNFSLSQDTTGVSAITPTSQPRYQIVTSFLDKILEENGVLAKKDFIGLTRCLVNSVGSDLRDSAPIDENATTAVEFRFYVPRYSTSSGMIIQGVMNGENPNLTTAWTMVGPPLTTVTIPFFLTTDRTLPQKATLGVDGYSWLSYQGQQLKGSIFINNTTIDLAKLYNLSSTGIMQKICRIEEEILLLGEELLAEMREMGFSNSDITTYYAWVDNYLEYQYHQNFFNGNPYNSIIKMVDDVEENMEYYDLLGRRVNSVKENALLKKSGNKAIILN